MTDYIQPKEIEKAREALRKQHQGTSVTNTSLFNLIIYAKNISRQAYQKKIAQSVIKKISCRIILITEDESSNEPYLRTFVSDLQPDDGLGTLFCDMINFEVSGTFRERIPFLVIPNLQPDRPVYFLRGDDPSKPDPVATELQKLATRTVFDSEMSASMTDFAKTLLALHATCTCDIGDLNFARFSNWRALFVYTFNDPEKLKTLIDAKDINIIYNNMESKELCHKLIQAIYFQAWIAIKLKWTYEDSTSNNESLSFKYKTSNGFVTINLLPGKFHNEPPGRLLKFEVFSIHKGHLVLEKTKQTPNQVFIHHSTPEICEMPAHYILDKEMAGKSMIHEIYSQGTRSSFIDTLKLITTYKEGSLCS